MAGGRKKNWAAYRRRVHKELGRRVEAAAIHLEGGLKEDVSTGFPPASSPGEPPNVRTGMLRASIAREVKGMNARVGTNLEYGLYLELGTSRMAPRPWLRPGLDKRRGEVNSILKGAI